jgi:predicted PilT family ATPase
MSVPFGIISVITDTIIWIKHGQRRSAFLPLKHIKIAFG